MPQCGEQGISRHDRPLISMTGWIGMLGGLQKPHFLLPERGWMSALLLIVLALGGSTRSALAQFDPLEVVSARSYSGQFIVQSPRYLAAPSTLRFATNETHVQLDPSLALVSCERIKQILGRELATSAPWRGKVFLSLVPAKSPDDLVKINAQQFRDGWDYRVQLPQVIERGRYVRAIVQVLLLEMANRGAFERSAELPVWLVEGITEQLLTSDQMAIILSSPRLGAKPVAIDSVYFDSRKPDPLTPARKELALRQPLTFEELSWPSSAQLSGDGGPVYRLSAQLFVTELERLEGGRQCLRAMVETLPRYRNWQFAFLQAFQAWFQRPLDVEKWWALQAVHFTGRDLAQTWSAEVSGEKLAEALRVPVQLRSGANTLPQLGDVNLQTVIREWEAPQQTGVVQEKIQQLTLLRQRVADSFVTLVDEYRETLSAYLENRDHTGLIPFRKNVLRRHAAITAVQRLDALDSRFRGPASNGPTITLPPAATASVTDPSPAGGK